MVKISIYQKEEGKGRGFDQRESRDMHLNGGRGGKKRGGRERGDRRREKKRDGDSGFARTGKKKMVRQGEARNKLGGRGETIKSC